MKRQLLFILCLMGMKAFSQVTINYDANQQVFTIKNKKVERQIQNDIKNGSMFTTLYRLSGSSHELCKGNHEEFDFNINDKPVLGDYQNGAFKYQNYAIIENADKSKILKIRFIGNLGSNAENISTTVCYQIYPDIAVIRKWLEITNLSSMELKLSDLLVEKLNIQTSIGDIYGNYARDLNYASYTGYWNDPAVFLHLDDNLGVILGNEVPSILKRTDVSQKQDVISIGTTLSTDNFPFRHWLKPGETFQSYKSFIVMFITQKEDLAFEGDLQVFINKYLGVKLFEHKRPPMFVYSPYIPFICDYSEKLYLQLIDNAAECGIDYFQITCGWDEEILGKHCSINHGDYKIDSKKFPNGLKPVTDSIRTRGMKPCLYFSLSAIGREGRMVKEHPDWLVLDKEGNPFNLHNVNNTLVCMCMSSGWRDYIKSTIEKYVEEFEIKWLMLDLSFIASAYVHDVHKTGCHAKNHGHKDVEESYYSSYNSVIQLFDELKAKFPDLYIDCTFELWGRKHIIDFALIEHADGDWITNLSSPYEMRQICQDRGRVIPTSPMLIGNLRMDVPQFQFNFWSLLSSTIVMLGDLRTLSSEQKKWYKDNITKLTEIEDKYQYSRSYVSIPNFQRPIENSWDGCIRFNKEKEGGLVCVYRNNSPEEQRIIQVSQLDPNSKYSLFSITKNKDLGVFQGDMLFKNGLPISISKINTAEIILIEKIDNK